MKVEILGLCWIDTQGLPTIDTTFLMRAGAGSWPHKVMVGLVATANTTPPAGYAKTDDILQTKNYRACIGCGLRDGKLIPSMTRVDPGYTPPPNSARLASWARGLVPLGDDMTYYPGEASALSGVTEGRAHPNTTLDVPKGVAVLAGAMIKFRAGAHTDQIGIDDASSPVHVPWVWSEFAVVSDDQGYRLLTRASTFPSSAWYVNGQQVGTLIQRPVTVSDTEPAISKGKPADQPGDNAALDGASGAIEKHPFTITAGNQQSFDISAYFDARRTPRSID